MTAAAIVHMAVGDETALECDLKLGLGQFDGGAILMHHEHLDIADIAHTTVRHSHGARVAESEYGDGVIAPNGRIDVHIADEGQGLAHSMCTRCYAADVHDEVDVSVADVINATTEAHINQANRADFGSETTQGSASNAALIDETDGDSSLHGHIENTIGDG